MLPGGESQCRLLQDIVALTHHYTSASQSRNKASPYCSQKKRRLPWCYWTNQKTAGESMCVFLFKEKILGGRAQMLACRFYATKTHFGPHCFFLSLIDFIYYRYLYSAFNLSSALHTFIVPALRKLTVQGPYLTCIHEHTMAYLDRVQIYLPAYL